MEVAVGIEESMIVAAMHAAEVLFKADMPDDNYGEEFDIEYQKSQGRWGSREEYRNWLEQGVLSGHER